MTRAHWPSFRNITSLTELLFWCHMTLVKNDYFTINVCSSIHESEVTLWAKLPAGQSRVGSVFPKAHTGVVRRHLPFHVLGKGLM